MRCRVKDALVPTTGRAADERKEIESLISQIDIKDTSSIIFLRRQGPAAAHDDL
jgi:hypothetical protein